MTAPARKALQKSLERDGLVVPLTINRRTGHLVAGHQRLDMIDALEKGTDYFLDVAVVDVDDKREKELNIRLNNEQLLGSFDNDALKKLVAELEFSPHTGFDENDLKVMFGADFVSKNAAETIGQMVTDAAAHLGNLGSANTAKPKDKTPEERVAAVNARVAASRDVSNAGDNEFYSLVVFKDNDERSEFLQMIGEPEDSPYVNGTRVIARLSEMFEEQKTSETK